MSKILVAEDDRYVRELVVDALFDAGYDVIEAKDGNAAVEKATSEHPDLVLLDIWMPGMDGFQVLGKLRDNPATASVPVVLLTALPATQGERDGLNLGALHYITKPWSPGVLEATVRVAMREARSGNGVEEVDSPVWAGSASYQRTSEGAVERGYIQTADLMIPLEQILGGGLSPRFPT